MTKEACTEQEFIALFTKYGATKLAGLLGINVRAVFLRRKSIEASRSIEIKAPDGPRSTRNTDYPIRVPIDIKDGVALIGSDGHVWPGELSTAMRGFIHLAGQLKPAALILNGDTLDGATISRHPPIGWESSPSIREEVDAVDECLTKIKKASPKSRRLWTVGNHDARFENRLSAEASQFKDVSGTRLKDHFPEWEMCWSIWINDEVVVKHRFKGGVHATHNNTLTAGKTLVTGHLHSLKVTPFADYNGNRFGVDTGTLADPYGDQFAYAEDNPLNHRSGFVVLTFKNRRLMWPEIVHVVDEDHIEFRGEIFKV